MWWSNISIDFKNKGNKNHIEIQHVLFYLFILGIIFGNFSYLIWTYDPVTTLAEKVIEIRPNSFAFHLWENPPYEILYKVYLFNVTNAEKFFDGEEKLTFQEVGPFVYREILFNTNVTFEDNGTMSFVARRKIVFMPELSVGDPNKDALLLPNVPLLGLTSLLEDYPMFVNIAVAQFTLAANSRGLINLTVNQYLFGYDDVLIRLANKFMPEWIDFARFSIVERLMKMDNGSIINMPVDAESLKARNGTIYSIEKFNGSPGLRQWGYDDESLTNNKCNTFNNNYFTGTIFPPRLKKNTSFLLYRHGFCRPLPIRFNHSDTSKYGFEVYTYQIDKSFLSTTEDNPDDYCFCLNNWCLPKGVGNISPCYYDIPAAISQPHFLNADPIVRAEINGMVPDPAKHDSYMVINPQSGLPLQAKLRVQVNLYVTETKFNYRTRPFNNLILPLVWVELSVEDPPFFINALLFALYVFLPTVQWVMLYALTFFAVVFTVGSVFSCLCIYVLKYRHYLEVDVDKYNAMETLSLKL